MTTKKKALVLTVGTGNIDDLERTLLKPMLKSIQDGDWARIVLLPSHDTENAARTLQARLPDPAVELKPLPKSGDENDADRCFGHFDHVLADLISSGFNARDIQADFTRGTKAMSAALVLAAVGRDIQILRYVYGEQRDERGMVVPGTEQVGQVRTMCATARRRLEQAKEFMRRGDFSAVTNLLPEPQEPFFRSEAEGLYAAAQIYAAWDRLAYKVAAQALAQHGETAEEAGDFALTPEMTTWLRRLTKEHNRKDHTAMAADLRLMACDLLANAERRIRDLHLEDALIRAYRVLELVGQIRLFAHGYDSAALPADDEVIQRLRKKWKRKGSNDFDAGKNNTLIASRLQVARLVKELGDPLGEKLLDFDKDPAMQVRNRNESVLVHGFEATAPPEEAPLRDVLDQLEQLLREDDSQATKRLHTARSLSFAISRPSAEP